MEYVERRASVFFLMLLAGCAGDFTPDQALGGAPLEGEAPLSVSLVTAPSVELGEFTGYFDAESGELHIEMVSAEAVDPLGQEFRTDRQALGFCNDFRINVHGLGVGINTVSDSVHTTVAECIPAAEAAAWTGLQYGEGGAFCATIRIDNRMPNELSNVMAEITEITSGYEGYRFLTATDPPCCGSGADLSGTNGQNQPTDLTGGVFLHAATMAQGESGDSSWVFRNAGGSFAFSGRVVAHVEELANGLDDDCDGRIDNGLQNVVDGGDCLEDIDCVSDNCVGEDVSSSDPEAWTTGACDAGCDPGYAGADCSECATDYFESVSGSGVHMGGYSNYLLSSDGSVYSYGFGGWGALGLGDTETIGDGPGEMGNNLVAVDLGTGHTATALYPGYDRACAVLEDASLKCWGSNWHGDLGLGHSNRLGDGAGEMGDNLDPVELPTGRTVIDIDASAYSTFALLDNGDLVAWGRNDTGQLGLGHTTTIGDSAGEMGDNLVPIDLGSGAVVSDVTSGNGHVCALLVGGSVKCWGLGQRLGLGTSEHRGDQPGEMGDALPTVDLGPGRTAVAISAGWEFTCALLDDATVKCWGSGTYGQMGQGSVAPIGAGPGEMGSALPPIDLGTGRTAVSISSAFYGACAQLDDGTVKCWGYNGLGRCGVGDTNTRGDELNEMGDNLAAVDLPAGTVTSLDSGPSYLQCVSINGEPHCWGYNSYGNLGIENTSSVGGAAGQMGASLTAVMSGDLVLASATSTCTACPDCGENGACGVTGGCECDEGWTGAACDLTCPDCGANGTCAADGGVAVCECDAGWAGSLCDSAPVLFGQVDGEPGAFDFNWSTSHAIYQRITVTAATTITAVGWQTADGSATEGAQMALYAGTSAAPAGAALWRSTVPYTWTSTGVTSVEIDVPDTTVEPGEYWLGMRNVSAPSGRGISTGAGAISCYRGGVAGDPLPATAESVFDGCYYRQQVWLIARPPT